MKTKNIIHLILLLALVLGAGWFLFPQNPALPGHSAQKNIYYCPMHPQYTSDHPGKCPICSMTLVRKENSSPKEVAASARKILYWTDTMIPGYKAAGPGKSPMGMDLTPVYEEPNAAQSSTESPSGYSTVSMAAPKQQLIGIRTAPVVKKPLVKTIHASGYVAHDLDLYNAQLEYIDAWRAYYPYLSRRPITDEYRQDWREYYSKPASQNHYRSDEKLKGEQRLIKAEYELLHLGLTENQIQQLRQIKYGQPWVQPDLLFFHADHPVWVYAQILESDLGFVDVGQKVSVSIPAYGETTPGIVRSVSLVVDPETRTTRARIEVPEYKGDLKVNMYVDVDFSVELDASIVVPREAVMDTGLRKIVFVKTPSGNFEPREIKTGLEGDGTVAVKSGLKEGETIVVSGNFLLDSESRLEASLNQGGSL